MTVVSRENKMGILISILALIAGVVAGMMCQRGGFPDPWQAVAVLVIAIAWGGSLVLGAGLRNCPRWKPRLDANGDVYAWMRPDWTRGD